MTSWPSIARTPPSTLYPADGTKWIARSDIAQTLPATAFGRAISIIELRGWLRSSSSPTGDPDWHYDLELDPLWLAQLGVSPSALCRPRRSPDPFWPRSGKRTTTQWACLDSRRARRLAAHRFDAWTTTKTGRLDIPHSHGRLAV